MRKRNTSSKGNLETLYTLIPLMFSRIKIFDEYMYYMHNANTLFYRIQKLMESKFLNKYKHSRRALKNVVLILNMWLKKGKK